MIRAFRRASLRAKLLVIIAVATIVPLMAGFAMVMFTDARALKREMIDSAVVIARVTAENSVGDVAFGDRDASSTTLAKLSSIPTVRHAYIFDNKGRLFSAYGPAEGAADIGREHSASLREFRDDSLYVSEPIIYEGERYGTIWLDMSTDPLEAKMRAHLLTLFVMLTVISALVVVISLRLAKFISEPILDLAALARLISEKHDYSVRIFVTREDEIGVLATGFNEMLAQIERRQRERDEADQRTREKSQFLANMSHELRTPLNAIIGFSEVLQARLEGRIADREEKFLDNIHSSGQHLLGIVNDILDLSKIEAGKMDLSADTIAVKPAIEGISHLMRGVSAKRKIALELEIDPTLSVVQADSVKFKQVLYNLLSNAVKFSPEDSVVTVRARSLDGSASPLGVPSLRIDVIDKGIGIDPKDHRRIFLEFQQVDSTTARQFEGTGLGLTLVKKFVEMHGGRVDLTSAIGEGSTFTVTMPLEIPQQVFGAAVAARSERGRRRILVIEDEDDAFHTIEQPLRKAGFETIHARTGEEGIRLAREMQPDAITLDLVLPGIDGFSVLKTLKADITTRAIPVIIVSLLDNRELGIAFGAREFLLKPIDGDRLLDALKSSSTPDGSRVLVIDDDASVHDAVADRLRPYGYTLTHAYGAVEGIARASADQPSLIILDLTMQEMDGFEVAARLKSNPRTASLPLLVVTKKELTGGERSQLNGKISALMKKGELGGGELVDVVRQLVGEA